MASRDDIVVATKVHGVMGKQSEQRGLSRKHIHRRLREFAARLGMDYVDLYQISPLGPADSDRSDDRRAGLAGARGKVRYLGASKHGRVQLSKALYTAKEKTDGTGSRPCRIITTSSTAKRSAR